MKIKMFYHSLVSDWNHGNAHFLRGITSELQQRGHEVSVYEPKNNWSRRNLTAEHGEAPIQAFHEVYPDLRSFDYDPLDFDAENAVADADLVIVHEWSSHDLVKRIGELRKRHDFKLLFHDTHHRLVTVPDEMTAYDLSNYDGVLAFGDVLKELYLSQSLARNAWTWHEAADTRVFHPLNHGKKSGDLVWIGNWGDGERERELHEFLIQPVKSLGLKATVHGVRYPDHAIAALKDAGIDYQGWLPNFQAPDVFARFRVTVHVPRGPYVKALPGIPTIRPFEAMACGIPLVSAPWQDAEGLFEAGKDYLVVNDGAEMTRTLKRLLESPAGCQSLASHALATIKARHTCAHRVDELLAIMHSLSKSRRQPASIVS